MTARWFRSVVVMLCMLAVATSASAEVTWVLWAERIIRAVDHNRQRQTVSPMKGFSTSSECEAAATVLRQTVGTEGRESVRYDEVLGKVTMLEHFYCLPDTIDPRGPKGK